MKERTRTSPGYTTVSFGTQRRMVAVNSAIARRRHTIHLVAETDVTAPRRFMAEYRKRTGMSLSFTAYVATCLARTLAEYPTFNSFRKGRTLYVLDDITVSIALERDIDGESVPQPIPIRAINGKTFSQVSEELRSQQRGSDQQAGSVRRASWVRYVPDALLRAFVRLMTRDPGVVQHVGVVGVSSVGMFASDPTWLVPLSPATVMVSVGSIVTRPILVDGELQGRERLCITASFDHDIVDGAPAARFMRRFGEILASGDEVRALLAE